jgi:O-antigen/teichoic acid export membrane protein
MSVLIGIALAAAILAAAPAAGAFLAEPLAVPVMQCLAVRALIGGLENIGVVKFQRDLQFDRTFRLAVLQKVIAFALTVPVAFILRDYWALVFGLIVGRVAGVALSYAMHPYRPRVSLARTRELWAFSVWTLLRAVGSYLNNRTPLLAAAQIGGTPGIGHYSVAGEIATAPTAEFTTPVIAALFPVMATVQHDPVRLRTLHLDVLRWSATIICATAVGVALVAHEMVPLFIGSDWTAIVPLMVWLSLTAGVDGLALANYTALEVTGRPRLAARLQWTRVAVVVALMVPAVWIGSLAAAAFARFLASVAMAPAVFLVAGRHLGIAPGELAGILWRPFVAAAAMAAAVTGLAAAWPLAGAPALARDVAAGGAVYVLASLALWGAAGCPRGPETQALAWLRRAAGRLRGGARMGRPGGLAADADRP